MSKLNIALLGSGIFARESHLPAILACEHSLNLVAVYSRSHKSAAALHDGLKESLKPQVQIYSDDAEAPSNHLDGLLERSDVHAVIIALPIASQHEYIKKCLAAGKHILSEKPVGKDVAQAKELIKLYEDQHKDKSLWIVGENWGFEPVFNEVARLVSVGEIGEVRHVEINSQSFVNVDNKYYQTSWRTVPDYMGGFLLDGAVHQAAILRTVFASPTKHLSALVKATHKHLPPADTIRAIFELENGVQGIFHVSFANEVSPKRPILTILGSKAILNITVEFAEGVRGYKLSVDGKDQVFVANGVKMEVAEFAEAALAGVGSGKAKDIAEKAGPRKVMEDLAFIEACLTSGEADGARIEMARYMLTRL